MRELNSKPIFSSSIVMCVHHIFFRNIHSPLKQPNFQKKKNFFFLSNKTQTRTNFSLETKKIAYKIHTYTCYTFQICWFVLIWFCLLFDFYGCVKFIYFSLSNSIYLYLCVPFARNVFINLDCFPIGQKKCFVFPLITRIQLQ